MQVSYILLFIFLASTATNIFDVSKIQNHRVMSLVMLGIAEGVLLGGYLLTSHIIGYNVQATFLAIVFTITCTVIHRLVAHKATTTQA